VRDCVALSADGTNSVITRLLTESRRFFGGRWVYAFHVSTEDD